MEDNISKGLFGLKRAEVENYIADLKRDYTMSSYTGDVEYNQSKIGVIKGFDIAFISRNRRI